MEHIPTIESDVQKVNRIARELGISLEDAAVTCDAFELAFSDDRMRRAIFEIIDQLDESAAKKGEPLGLIIRYTVELGMDGIRVGRYADEIPPGQVVSLTPTNRAVIFLKIKDNFPTQQFLGPLIVNRPELPSLARRSTGQSSWPERGWQPLWADGVVCSDTEVTEPEIPTELPSHWPDVPICLGPIRLTFNERFPFQSAAASQSQRGFFLRSADRMAIKPHHHLPQSTALNLADQSTSGLSPPLRSENLGHSDRKMFRRHW